MIVPTEVTWAMQLDWRYHFLGWLFFRHEPWHLPPGRIDGYFQPLGTAIGLTDSIPIAAFLFKPFAALLPVPFQYLGLWLLLCFALQGVFGALLMRLWTPRASLQLLGAACFILMPTLLIRVGHPALCAHWLVLWALWLYQRFDRRSRAWLIHAAVLPLIAAMVHPYLALMVLALVGALGIRLLRARQPSGIATIGVATIATLLGWWLSGLFTVSGTENLMSEGLRNYSMNLLAPITPTGWSTILPEVPIGTPLQVYEGFQYFGLGLLLLMLAALAVRFGGTTQVVPSTWTADTTEVAPSTWIWPLLVVVIGLAIYSLSPRVTVGSAVVFDITSPLVERLAIFRATGRFFWPAAYLMLMFALAVVVSRLKPRVAAALLCLVIVVQLVDLREAHAFRRRTARDEATYAWRPTLQSPAWPRVLARYQHVVVYPPVYCGTSPVDLDSLAFLAGAHGLTLNSGLVARFDETRRRAACRELADSLGRGEVDDTRIYVGRPGEIEPIMKRAPQQPMVCGVIDAAGVCVTARSYEAWRDLARLE